MLLRSLTYRLMFVSKSKKITIVKARGFPLGEIFRPNRHFLLSYKHSDGTNKKSFEFEQ